MRIRTQLIVTLVLLAVLPLSGIVLYSYLSSRQALAAAAEAEAERLNQEMQMRLVAMRDELEGAAQRFGAWAFHTQGEEESLNELELARALGELGEDAELLDSFVLRSAPPAAPAAPEPPAGTVVGAGDAAAVADQMLGLAEGEVRVDVASILRLARDETLAELAAEDVPPFVETGAKIGFQVIERIIREHAAADDADADDAADDAAADDAADAAADDGPGPRPGSVDERRQREAERQQRFSRRMAELQRRLARLEAVTEQRVASERAAPRPPLGSEPPPAPRLFGLEEIAIRDGERVLGSVRPRFDGARMVERILARTERGGGDVPFAVDAEGALYVAAEEDRATLADVGLPALVRAEAGSGPTGEPVGAMAAGGPLASTRRIGDWLVVSSRDPGSDLVLGIASPLGSSLADLRAASVRNLVIGLVLITAALIGILPLSRRMTKNLDRVTAGVERIARGDLDTRVEVRSKDELGQLAHAFNRMAGDLEAHQRRAVDQGLIAAELARKNEELEEARRFQLSMLPQRLPEHPAFEVAVEMRTAAEVGGDYYDFLREDDGTLTIAIGDATGHGAAAGRMVTVIKSLFCSWQGNEPPATFLAAAQRTVKRLELGRMAMALALARFSPRVLTVASAGMPPALVYRAASGEVEEITAPGMPLGGLDESFPERLVPLAPGDLVLLLSDGFPELPDQQGEPLGYDATRSFFAEAAHGEPSPREVIESLLAALDARTGGQPPADDVTFLAVRVR